MNTVNDCIRKCFEWGVSTINQLTFFANRLTGLLPFHHVIIASGRDPDVLHSTSYLLSADTYFSCVIIFTDLGFTGKKMLLKKVMFIQKKKKSTSLKP